MHNCKIIHFLDTLGWLFQLTHAHKEIIPRLTTKCPQKHRQHIWQWSFILTSKWSNRDFRWLSRKKQDDLLTHTCRGTCENEPGTVLSILSSEAIRLGRAGCGVSWGLHSTAPEAVFLSYFCRLFATGAELPWSIRRAGTRHSSHVCSTSPSHIWVRQQLQPSANTTSSPHQKRQVLISQPLTRGKSSMRRRNGKRVLEKNIRSLKDRGQKKCTALVTQDSLAPQT